MLTAATTTPSLQAAGVDTATGVPNGLGGLVEIEAAPTTAARPNQGALDVHGPYGSNNAPNTLYSGESQILFHSEFGDLALPQFEAIAGVLPDPGMWPVHSAAQNERTPNGASTIEAAVGSTLGLGLANFTAATEQGSVVGPGR